MEQVLDSLTMESSEAHSFGMKAFFMKGTNVQKPKNNVRQVAKAQVIRR